MNVAVLGINGMLGSKVYEVCKNSGLTTVGFTRLDLDAEFPDISQLKDYDYIINCIGIIKPYIHDDILPEVVRAIKVNSIFPYELAKTNKKIIQIATDCVWDGVKGNYVETDPHNATDVYGKTKSLGEVKSNNFLNLRCSIIGLEKKGYLSLLEWFLHQPKNAEIKGFKNHLWNGLTTDAFARICVGIIKNNSWFSGTKHVVPADIVSKAEMLHIFAKHFKRADIKITDVNADISIDRTIITNDPERNKKFWSDAGYDKIPTVKQMIEDILFVKK